MFLLRSLLAPLAAAVLLASCAGAPAPREPLTVRVIAFNDFHGNLEPASLNLPWGTRSSLGA